MGVVVNGKFASQRVTGVQRVAYELVREMQSQISSPDDLPLVVPPGANDLGLATRPSRKRPRLSGNLWEQLVLPRESAREVLLSLCNAGPLLKRRHVVMIYDMAVYDVPSAFSRKFVLWYRFMFWTLRRRADRILTVSDFSKKQIGHHLKVDPSSVEVVRPGADHMDRIEQDESILARLDLEPETYCVLVGSMDPRKNLSRALAAAGLMDQRHDVKFVVVGGANRRVFSDLVLGPESSPNIVWAGVVSDEELKALYLNASCLVLPSLYEGYGLPAVEAMRCGCPVIVSTEASLPEVCGDAAMYCDAESVADIAAKVELMTTDPALRELHRQRGLQRVRDMTWRNAAAQLLQILAIDPVP